MIKQLTYAAAITAVLAAASLEGCASNMNNVNSHTPTSSSIVSQATSESKQHLSNKEFTAADIGRPETMELVFLLEGAEERKNGILNFGEMWDYSLYLTDEWEDSGPDLWVSNENPDVHISVINHDDMSVQDLIEVITSDYSFEPIDENSDELWKCVDEDTTVISKIVVDGKNVYELQFEYPNEAEEGYGSRWMTYFDTFKPFDRVALDIQK